jgi:hypothetical protein
MTILNMALMLSALCKPFLCPDSRSPEYFSQQDSLKVIEKVYLHSDRENFLPGDDIWFKAYLIDASSNQLTDHSGNLHVELISPSMNIVDSRIVKLSSGLGNGDFHLTDDIKSGRYHLRAYTNYMRNFGDQLFFNKEITIINPSDAERTFSEGVDSVANRLEITFFPEGGSLVDNVVSVVAFKAVNANGESCDVTGAIYSSAGEIVATIKSLHRGMGTFSISPFPGTGYYAIVKDNSGDEIRKELPRSFPKGFVLNVSKNRNNDLVVTVRTNTATLASLTDPDLSVNVSSHSISLKKADFSLKSLANRFILPVNDLPEGIVSFTISGQENIPLCERLVYIKNNEFVNIHLETNESIYKQRDSVSLKVSLRVNSLKPQDAFLSLSATKEISEKSSSQISSSISSWFLLESDIHGPVEEASYYFDPANPNRLRDLDLLLLTQGWRDFKWKYKDIQYPAENGFSISGRVRKKFADVPLKETFVTIAIFKNGNPVIGTALSDNSGKFSLNGLDLTGEAKLIASVTGDKDKPKGWLILDSAKYSPATLDSGNGENELIQKSQFVTNDQQTGENPLNRKDYHTFIQYSNIITSIQKKYKLSDTIRPGEVSISAKRKDWTETSGSKARHYLMGTPDKEMVITKELESYNTVGVLVGDRIIRSFKMKGEFFTWNMSPGITNPIYMLDGAVVTEDQVALIPLKWVERIDVLDNIGSIAGFGVNLQIGGSRKQTNDKASPVPTSTADGVISVILKNGYVNEGYTSLNSVSAKLSGYNEPRLFYSPKHHTSLEKDYKPDLRTTLFWEPNIKVENNKSVLVNYFNADNPSKVKIVVEGITTAGIPVTGKIEYEVK